MEKKDENLKNQEFLIGKIDIFSLGIIAILLLFYEAKAK
jgi:hypothetical protein